MNDTNEIIERQAAIAIALEKEVGAKIAELKEKQDQITAEWKRVEGLMIDNNVKSIKGDWGSLTIAERTGFDVDKDQLPPRFWKRVPDESKIRTIYQLEGKAPRGTTPKLTKYLTKRIKEIS